MALWASVFRGHTGAGDETQDCHKIAKEVTNYINMKNNQAGYPKGFKKRFSVGLLVKLVK